MEGTPTKVEEWKDIKGYEGRYQISSFGRVKSLNYHGEHIERILKPEITPKGYLRIDLRKNGKKGKYLIHRLVAINFIENPNNYPQVNHKDEDKTNNKVENLEWCNNSYNCNYGTFREKVSKSSKRKREIICITTGKKFNSLIEAEKEYNIKYQNISECCRGKRKTAGGYRWKYK